MPLRVRGEERVGSRWVWAVAALCAGALACGPFGPAASTPAGLIAFSSNDKSQWQIYTVHADGTEPTKLSDGTLDDFAPLWSPDGSQIAFMTGLGQSQGCVMASDGSSRFTLTGEPEGIYDLAWLPDGKQLMFTSLDENQSVQASLINSDGTGVKPLTDEPRGVSIIALSPDGTKLAFISPGDGDSSLEQLTVMALDGSSRAELTANPDGIGLFAWTPDSKQIAYLRFTAGSRSGDLHVINVDGSDDRQILSIRGDIREIAWSPDGKKLLYVVEDVVRVMNLFVIDVDGGGDGRNLTGFDSSVFSTPLQVYRPRWSPDGAWITYEANPTVSSLIYIMAADGSGGAPLVKETVAVAYAEWSP